jgi:hypothetical protein
MENSPHRHGTRTVQVPRLPLRFYCFLTGIAERPLPCNYNILQFVCALSRQYFKSATRYFDRKVSRTAQTSTDNSSRKLRFTGPESGNIVSGVFTPVRARFSNSCFPHQLHLGRGRSNAAHFER